MPKSCRPSQLNDGRMPHWTRMFRSEMSLYLLPSSFYARRPDIVRSLHHQVWFGDMGQGAMRWRPSFPFPAGVDVEGECPGTGCWGANGRRGKGGQRSLIPPRIKTRKAAVACASLANAMTAKMRF